MKIIKISQDHYVIVDDSEIKPLDWCLDKNTNLIFQYYTKRGLKSTDKKITHSTPNVGGFSALLIAGIKELSLQEVKELIGEVDVEKKAERDRLDTGWEDSANLPYTSGFVRGYNQALEGNKEKKFTEEDMVEAFKMGLMKLSDQRLKDYMQHKTEWEVEFIDGQLKQRQ